MWQYQPCAVLARLLFQITLSSFTPVWLYAPVLICLHGNDRTSGGERWTDKVLRRWHMLPHLTWICSTSVSLSFPSQCSLCIPAIVVPTSVIKTSFSFKDKVCWRVVHLGLIRPCIGVLDNAREYIILFVPLALVMSISSRSSLLNNGIRAADRWFWSVRRKSSGPFGKMSWNWLDGP